MPHITQPSLTEAALDKTMNLFWKKGYFNTSIEDIISITGISRAALYKNFGGKEGLFNAMLARFRKNVTDQVMSPLQKKTNGMDGIITFFTQFLDLYDTAGLCSRGCFLVSTAAEVNSHTKDVEKLVKVFLSDLGKSFRSLLMHAKAERLLKSGVEIDSVADFLVGNLFGLMTLCRSSAPKQIFENHVHGITDFIASLTITRLSKIKKVHLTKKIGSLQ